MYIWEFIIFDEVVQRANMIVQCIMVAGYFLWWDTGAKLKFDHIIHEKLRLT